MRNNGGFMMGLIMGGLLGAYYGLQMTTRDRREMRSMAMRAMDAGKDIVEDAVHTMRR